MLYHWAIPPYNFLGMRFCEVWPHWIRNDCGMEPVLRSMTSKNLFMFFCSTWKIMLTWTPKSNFEGYAAWSWVSIQLKAYPRNTRQSMDAFFTYCPYCIKLSHWCPWNLFLMSNFHKFQNFRCVLLVDLIALGKVNRNKKISPLWRNGAPFTFRQLRQVPRW